MNLKVKIYVMLLFFFFIATLLMSLVHSFNAFQWNFMFSIISLCFMLVFLNSDPNKDMNSELGFLVLYPILLPTIIFLPTPYVALLTTFSTLLIIIRLKVHWIKLIFNITMSSFSAVLASLFYNSIYGNNLPLTASGLVVLLITSVIYFASRNLMLLIVLTLNNGTRDKKEFLAIFEMSKRNAIIIFLGIINSVTYSFWGIFGTLGFTLIIFMAKPMIMQFIKNNNELITHTTLILKMLEAKDPMTHRHSERVKHWTMLIARNLKISQSEAFQLSQAASWHDIGKIQLPTELLQKDGKLTDEEYKLIQQHPEMGYQLVKDLQFFRKFLDVIRHHHEKMDGTGYPLGLTGERIPYHARIVCVADSFDAMTMDRSYRPGLSMQDAVAELVRCAGTQFDPDIVKIFVLALQEEYGEYFEKWNKETFELA